MTDSARFWTPAAFAEITGGHWLTPPADGRPPLAVSASTAARWRPARSSSPSPASASTAMGLDQVQAAGAGSRSSSRTSPPAGDTLALLRVESTVAALQALATRWRDVARRGLPHRQRLAAATARPRPATWSITS
jgi:hypothetical protein